MTRIRVAVIGAGGIGGVHLGAYADWPDLCEIVAVADTYLPAAQEKAEKYGGQAFESYAEMLDTVRPDAISVCTPPVAHRRVVEAAAQRGMSVLCEKPPARTLAETEAIVAAMEHSRGILQ